MLCQQTQITSLHKVRAHISIQGNEKVDELAKAGKTLHIHSSFFHMNMLTQHHIIYI